MTSTIITILLALNLLTSAAEWDSLTPEQQGELTEIVNADIVEG